MRPLDYQTPPRAVAPRSAALVVLPTLATAVTFVAVWHNGEREPFGVFIAQEAIVQLGSPLLALGLWVYWGFRASRERLSASTVVPLVAWAALLLALSFGLGIGYFFEP